MKPLLRWATRIAADLVLALLFIVGGIFFYTWATRVSPPTEFFNPTTDRAEYSYGDYIRVDYIVVRHVKSCRLEIARYIVQHSVPRERIINYEQQPIKSDDPTFRRPSHYIAKLPDDIPTDDYNVFSRVRYHCDWLDEIPQFSRVTDMMSTTIHIRGNPEIDALEKRGPPAAK